MKKYTFNLDLIIVVIVLFALCIGASLYQRYLHGELHNKNIALQIKLTIAELELIDANAKLKKLNQ